jgi:myo-inositol-1(or 4)-monophosphatase
MAKAPTEAQLLACAHELADAAQAAIRPYFRRPIAVTNKAGGDGFDPVTLADQAAERAIAKRLKALFPDHGLVGEEHGTVNPDARYRWIVDPIDGTRAFIMGLPTWGTLIGLVDGDRPILGMMDQPFTGERFFAGAKSAHLAHGGKTRKLATRICPNLADAILSSTHPDLFARPRERKVLARLKGAARMTRYGGDCYAYCMLAAGHIDAIVEPGLNSYDIAAIIPIIERAGGRVTTWDGSSAVSGGDIVACGDPALHAAILAEIAAV